MGKGFFCGTKKFYKTAEEMTGGDGREEDYDEVMGAG